MLFVRQEGEVNVTRWSTPDQSFPVIGPTGDESTVTRADEVGSNRETSWLEDCVKDRSELSHIERIDQSMICAPHAKAKGDA